MKGKKILCYIVFLCFVILFMPVLKCISAEETFLFSKTFSGVYLMKGDSEEVIIKRQGPYIAPRLSPDGEKILFHSNQGGKIGVWFTDLQGKEKERFCDGDQADWSPDGKRIIFRREGRIIEKELASGKEAIITPESWVPCEFPTYLPDERMIFVLKGDRKDKIFLINYNKDTPLEPLVEGEIMSVPKCSPDGKKIAYQDGAHIYMIDIDDRKIRQLTLSGGVQSCPVWSMDSRSICYCQSSEAFGGPWDICRIAIDSPQDVGTVIRDVGIGFDGHGSSPSISATAQLKGNSINLWQVENINDKESRKALPMDKYNLEGEVAVENDWIVFYLSTKENKLTIFPRETDKTVRKEIELTAINKEGKSATRVKSIHVLSNDGEKVILEVRLSPESSVVSPTLVPPSNGRNEELREEDEMEAIFTVPRSRPFVEIKPVKNIDRIYAKRETDLALLPDRFADDLILDPYKYLTNKVPLPYSHFLIGLPNKSDMFMVITPSDKQSMWLIKGKAENYFEGVEVLTGGEDLFVSILSDRDLWYRTEVTADSDTNGWKIKWSNPFLAQWRTAVEGKGKYYSRMWDEEALNTLKESSLPMEEKLSEVPELSIVYVYGRSWNTPLNIVTPMDVLQDALGIDRLSDVLDMEGIRNYRTAEEWVPLHVFLTSQENRLWPQDSPGCPQTLDFSPIIELLGRMRMVERKGVESTTTHLCEDILNSLKGLDNRIEEYKKFLVGLDNLCKTNRKKLKTGNVPSITFLNAIEKNIVDLRRSIADLPITGIGVISDSIEAIKSCMGTQDTLSWDRIEFEKFRDVSKSALLERQQILTKYRNFVKELRNSTGIIITEQPETIDIYEEIRLITQNILRERYYLEGDWRGEKPLE